MTGEEILGWLGRLWPVFLSNKWSLMWQSLYKNQINTFIQAYLKGDQKEIVELNEMTWVIKLIVESLLRTQYLWKNNIFHLESAVALILALVLFSHHGSTVTGLRLPPHHSPRLRRENPISFCCRSGFIFFSSPSRVSLLILPPSLPSAPSPMPRVGGHCRRWEVRARVCACNHGNSVLIGRRSGRMIVSCCQRGLLVQTCGRFWRAPDGSLRHEKESLSPLFHFKPFKINFGGMRLLLGVNNQCAAGLLERACL